MLELPGQRRVRFFNTCPPLSPFLLCCWPFLLLPALFVFLLFLPVGLSDLILIGVLESSDQGRVRILNTPLPPPIFNSTPKSAAQELTV